MKLKFKKGSPLGDMPSTYSAKLPNGNWVELFKSGSDWAARELKPNGEELEDNVGVPLACDYYPTKRAAVIDLKQQYEN